MYEKIAWENFLKTGDLETFIEYKKLIHLIQNEQLNNDLIDGTLDDYINEKLGEKFYETSKSKGYNN